MIQSGDDQKITQRGSAIVWLMMMLALVPALLFAYLGHFIRLIGDDYRSLSIAFEMDAWATILYWRDIWTGTYTRWVLIELLAPLDVALPPIFPAFLILMWLLSLVWLFSLILSALKIMRHRSALALILAALVIAATINGLYSPQSFYWFSGSVVYFLPLVLLTAYAAIVIEMAHRLNSKSGLLLGALASAAIALAIAGFSEMFLVFQMTILSIALVFVYVFLKRDERRPYALLLGAGWLGTWFSFLIQITAPGTYVRMAEDLAIAAPIRSLPEILSRTLNLTFQYVGHQEAFAGFMMLFGIGFFVALVWYRVRSAGAKSAYIALAAPPLWLGLIIQVCFIPILWTHHSDNPQLLGRFSFGFMAVVLLNLVCLVLFLLLIWRRRWIEGVMAKRQDGLMVYCSAVMLAILFFFALTQIRSIHYKAATYLFVTALMLIGIFCWQLAGLVLEPGSRKFGLVPLMFSAATLITIVALVSASLYGHGFMSERIMASAAFMQVAAGLIWGVYAGLLLQHGRLLMRGGDAWLKYAGLLAALVSFSIGLGLVLGHSKLIPDFATYAREWDARHELIIHLRDSGHQNIEVPPLSFDLPYYLELPERLDEKASKKRMERYYGVASINVMQD